MRPLVVRPLGLRRYEEALVYQRELVGLRQTGSIPDQLLLLEHYPVVTMGRGGDPGQLLVPIESLRRRGIDFHEGERGGGATYHGPGQLVVYPIIDLRPGRDIHGYLRGLEEAVKLTLDKCGVRARRLSGLTGVWLGDKKLSAIGVRVQRWVTSHGVSVNVDNDLAPYRLIQQCGLKERGATSMREALGPATPAVPAVAELFSESFAEVFGYRLAGDKEVDECPLAQPG
jgi:lipoyl(octanoyl) transferase